MNSEEIQSLIEQLKAQGLSEDEIMNVFYEAFVQGKMDRKDLETLAEAMGYELTDDFKNEPTPDPIASPEGGELPEGGLTEETLEDAKAIEPEESAEEFKEDIDAINKGEAPAPKEEKEEPEEAEETEESESEDEEKAEEDGEEEESEDEEWEKAQKMFKI